MESIIPASEVLIKGVYIQQLLKEIKRIMNPAQYAQFDKDINHKIFSPIKDYKAEEQKEIEKRCGELLFPSDPPDQQAEQAGRISFSAFKNSLMGKTILPLLGKNPKSLTQNLVRAFSTLMKGIKVEATETGETSMTLHIYNNPYHSYGMKGLLMAGLEYIHANGKVNIHHIQGNEFEYLLSWENNVLTA